MNLLDDLPQDKSFFCHDGKVFKNLKELGEGFTNMSDETFQYHVNIQKNDFASWIYDCIGDVDLANSIRASHNKKKIAQKIKSRINSIKNNKASGV